MHSGVVITLLTILCIAARENSDDCFCGGILTESSHDKIEGILNEEKEHLKELNLLTHSFPCEGI